MENQGLYLTPFEHKLLLNLETDLRPQYRRRIEIMLLADAGKSQTQICEALLCSQETTRYWIDQLRSIVTHRQDYFRFSIRLKAALISL